MDKREQMTFTGGNPQEEPPRRVAKKSKKRFLWLALVTLLALIAAGGVLYTLGAWFYARKGFRYHHMVWHLLIDLAVAAHFAGIVFYLY